MNKKMMLMSFVFVMLMGLTARVSFATDPLEADPDMYKLKFENEKVRVMEVTFQPGQSIAEHTHPDHFVHVEEAGQLKITKSDGTVTNADLKTGDVVWIPAETHRAENTGSTVVRLLVTELK